MAHRKEISAKPMMGHRIKKKLVVRLQPQTKPAQRNDWQHINLAAEVPRRVPDWDKLVESDKIKASIKVICSDFKLFCVKNLWITNKKGELVPLVPNPAQLLLLEAVMDDLAKGIPVRYIVLKARQMGLSTIIEAIGYWWAATHPYTEAAIAAHDSDAAKNIYRMFQRYYENTDNLFRPKSKYYTKNDLTFDTEKGTGLKSSIKTFVAKQGGVGRSSTNRFLHGSEVAFWDGGSEIVAGLLQTVPLLAETFIFLESTANGVGGFFYHEWMNAKMGKSEFKPFFFPWHAHPEYELNVPPKIQYSNEEKALLKLFEQLKYPERSWKRKIMWRRAKMRQFGSDPKAFMQEYPSTDIEAFVASGRPVFDVNKLIQMELKANTEPFNFCNISGTTKHDIKVQLVDYETPFKVWEIPENPQNNEEVTVADDIIVLGRGTKEIMKNPNAKKTVEKYIIAIDVAEGIDKADNGKEGDYSVIDVMKMSNLKTVARWRGHVDPDQLGDLACIIGWWYNTALIGPEINNHGLTTMQRIRDRFYRNVYMRETGLEETFEKSTSKMGWRTDRKTKPLMIDELAKAIRDNDIIDYDITFIRECMTYVRDDRGYTNAQEGNFDDCVMAKAIGLQLFNWMQIPRDRLTVHQPNKPVIQASGLGGGNAHHVVRRVKRITKT